MYNTHFAHGRLNIDCSKVRNTNKLFILDENKTIMYTRKYNEYCNVSFFVKKKVVK